MGGVAHDEHARRLVGDLFQATTGKIGNMAEEVRGVGYINGERKHAMISVAAPTIINARKNFAQLVITIDTARELERQLNNFLQAHDYEN
jgi:hypothetical protein